MNTEIRLGTFIWRITATHTIAYFIAGIFAIGFLGYEEIFGQGALSFMRPTDSAWVAAGPGLQLIRGILLALVLYPVSTVFFQAEHGWMRFWLLQFGLAYILTVSAATGSFEGIIYTNIPLKYHLIGLPEILLYVTLFTLMMRTWYRKPGSLFQLSAIVLVSIIVLMSVMGTLAAAGIMQVPQAGQ